MSEKPFKTIDKQLKILKDRDLVILNENAAKKTLQDYGYFKKYPDDLCYLKESMEINSL